MLILEIVKLLCFDTLLQMLLLRSLPTLRRPRQHGGAFLVVVLISAGSDGDETCVWASPASHTSGRRLDEAPESGLAERRMPGAPEGRRREAGTILLKEKAWDLPRCAVASTTHDSPTRALRP